MAGPSRGSVDDPASVGNDPVAVFDGHNDALLDVHLEGRGEGRSLLERSETGHLDLPRARTGGFAGGVFAVFVPNEDADYERRETDEGYEYPLAEAVDPDRAKSFTYDVLARLYRAERDAGGDLRVTTTVAAVRAAIDDGALAVVPHLEGAAAVAADLSNLDFLYAAGVRSIGPVWSRPNAFGHGVPFRFPGSPDVGPGLTDAGRDLVAACNNRGIVVDCAHLNAAGFWDVAETSSDPLVVSHAGAHGVSPNSRTLTDDQIDAVGNSGGVVGISFAAGQLRPDPGTLADDPGGGADESAGEDEVPLTVIGDHVAYVADRIGVEGVALGSDFDGATPPDGIDDVTDLPRVVDDLRSRGFDEGEIEQIARENWLRVLEDTWGE